MPDYLFLLDSRLTPEQRAVVARVQEASLAAGVNVYLTGGAVRDLISGQPIRDLDFTVEGSAARLARELEKDGAAGPGTGPVRVLGEDERLRHIELLFPGDLEGSVSSARNDVYSHPGAKPEIHFSSITDDLRRRDFSMNAIAISLNPASRGLLLDPTNGLADLERREVRAMSNHSFTNQPIRLLRILRYCARLDFKMEQRTGEWFALALERRLHESLGGELAGRELLQLAREEKPAAILKEWERRGLIGALHPQLARRHPHYDGISVTIKVRESLLAAGYAPGSVSRALVAPMTLQVLGRLKPREQSSALSRMEIPSRIAAAVSGLESECARAIKMLMGRKTTSPREAYIFLEHLPMEQLIFIQTDFSQVKALAKIKKYLQKWRPLRQALPAAELEALGVPRGPKFDKILENLFDLQLNGRGRAPDDRIRLLRQLAGIKPEPKKKKEEPAAKEKGKGRKEAFAAHARAGAEEKARQAAHAQLAKESGKKATPAKPAPARMAAAPHHKPARAAHSKPARKPKSKKR